ncbi:hypothetical protein TD95_005306 [Thielaviopsis punctulata]|uniref:Arsenical-resistance protein ACR3 n=1 Tax=Thielaviopsis punctulata TaxID=72032 RepID=A0A0F4ZII7_9PEZI|nr:hypothetical protein TD95_005306 [Thielaviopsis punctulata]
MPEEKQPPKLPWLSRLLALWIFLAMLTGLLLGAFVPSASTALQRGSFAHVSGPLAAGLLVMMYPILCGVQFSSLSSLRRDSRVWRHVAASVAVNWAVAPLVMTAWAWAFLWDRQDLRMGVVLVGLGRCIAMVFVWSAMAGGDTAYCALLVAINSLLQLVLFAPLSAALLRIDSSSAANISPPYSLVATSVGVFLGLPLAAAVLTQAAFLLLSTRAAYTSFVGKIAPISLLGLVYVIIVLFASQGARVVHQIAAVARVSVPLVVYFVVLFFAVLGVARRAGVPYEVAVVQALTAASNNFELAIAVAVAVYGADSGQALAATVGPLVEVPVLVGLVYVSRWLRERLSWGEAVKQGSIEEGEVKGGAIEESAVKQEADREK